MLGGSKDPALAHQLQRVQVAAGVVDGEVYVAEIGEENETDVKIIAAAVWFPPGKVMMGRYVSTSYSFCDSRLWAPISEAQREAGANEFFANLDPNLSKWWTEVVSRRLLGIRACVLLRTIFGNEFFPTFDQLSISAYGEGVKLASWHLLQLGVRPAYQRIGIAKALVNAVKEKVSTSYIHDHKNRRK